MGKAHANAWMKVGRFFDLRFQPELQSAVGRNTRETRDFASRWGFSESSTDWREAVRSDQVDLVDVCTPNDSHAAISIAALRGGKHVACEKPLAGTLADARKMRDAARVARRKGVHSFVWFSYRGCPALALAHRMVRSGALGRIYHVRANYLQDWGGPNTPLVWRFQKRLAGSGAHGDLNAHLIDAARFVTGQEMTEVCGAAEETFIRHRALPGRSRGGKRGKVTVDDAVLFLARMSGGAVASFEATRLATGNQNANRIEVNGDLGSIRWDFEEMNVLWHFDAKEKPGRAGWRRIMCTDPSHPFVRAWWPAAHLLGYEHGFVNLAACMMDTIAGRKPEVPVPDFEDAYQTQRVLEAAIRSARLGRSVRMNEVK